MWETWTFALDANSPLKSILQAQGEYIKAHAVTPKILEISPVDLEWLYKAMYAQNLPFFQVSQTQELESGTARFVAKIDVTNS